MVGADRLGAVNGVVHSVAGIGQVLAPVLAGALVTTVGLPFLVMLDLGTFVIALVCILVVRVPNAPRSGVGGGVSAGWFADFAGLALRARASGLLAMFGFTSLRNYLFATCEVVIVPLLLIVTTPEKTGVVLSVAGLGVIAGGLAMGVIGRSRRLMPFVIAAQGLTGVAMLIGGVTTNLVVIAAVMALAFVAFPIEEASSTTIMQRKVPAALLGRVASVRNMMAMSAPPLAMLIAAPLADRVFEPAMAEGGALAGSFGPLIGVGEGRGMALLLVAAGVVTLAVTLAGWLSRRLRNLEADLPDQDHGADAATTTRDPGPALAPAAVSG